MSSTPEQLEETAIAEAMPESETMTTPADEDLVAEELLVEDVSIDGMCGVY